MTKKKRISVMGIVCLAFLFCLPAGCKKERDESLELPVLSAEEGKTLTAEAEPGSAGGSGPAGKEAAEETAAVYLCGEVVKPGVYELPAGSRIVDALIAAGGFTKEAAPNYLNQARALSDGEMIYVPSRKELENGPDQTEGTAVTAVTQGERDLPGTGQSNGLININTADKATLMTIAGVGESKAEKIIAYREESGSFRSIEDIMNVPGIKEGMFNKIRDQICVK